MLIVVGCAVFALALLGGCYVLLRRAPLTGVTGIAFAAARHTQGVGAGWGSLPASAGPGASGSGAASAGPSTTPSAGGSAGRTQARPTASPQPPPAAGGFPNAATTGVPAGTSLAAFGSSCAIKTANTVIDGRLLNCSVTIQAANVTIKRSKVVGGVSVSDGSLTIQDSEVDNGTAFVAAVGGHNITVLRANIHGGETGVSCDANCSIRDSWLHGQYIPPGGNWHLDAFITNGGNHITLAHNTLACDNPGTANGGCSGDVGVFGDFATNSYLTFDHNLFVASPNLSYCAYGGAQDNKPYGHPDHIVFTNNVFQRGPNGHCGEFGPVAHFDAGGTGNVWSNNVWEDGELLTT